VSEHVRMWVDGGWIDAVDPPTELKTIVVHVG
jgi:hypothetical protein